MTTTTTVETKKDIALDFLSTTLFQFFTKEHFENNQGITIGDSEWERFVDECNGVFADACGEIASEVWEANNSDYEFEYEDTED